MTSYHGLAGNFEEMNVYAGILPLLMVPFSWRARRRPPVLFFWLAALVSALLWPWILSVLTRLQQRYQVS